MAADLDNRLYEQYYSGQEVPDHLAPYSVVRYYYNTTPSRVLVVEPHTMSISHGGPRVVLHGNGNHDLEVLEELMAKNPYCINKGVLMTSKVPSGMLNYETYQIFLLSDEDKQRNNLLGSTSTMMVTLKMGYTTMVPQPPYTGRWNILYHIRWWGLSFWWYKVGTSPCQYRTGKSKSVTKAWSNASWVRCTVTWQSEG